MTSAVASEYLTITKACALAGISKSTFYRLMADQDTGLGRIMIRIPGMQSTRIPRARFLSWMEGTAAPAR